MSNKHSVTFDLKEPTSVTALATFVAQLVKEGVTYNIEQSEMEVTVELTGGY